jgi:cation transport regulator ChaC
VNDPAALLWYFAYGSNLDPGTFVGRRRMRPCESHVALLREHRLVFDLPIGDGERGVGNLLPSSGEVVYGVAYRITSDEAERLDRTEGVPHAYRRLDVVVETLDESPLTAFTYLSPHRRSGRKPSERYLSLLLRGARHHGLPALYVSTLAELERAVDERERQLSLFAARDLIPRRRMAIGLS